MMLAPPTIDPVEQRRPRQPGSRRPLSVLWNSVLRLVHGGYAPGSVTLLEKQLGLDGYEGHASGRQDSSRGVAFAYAPPTLSRRPIRYPAKAETIPITSISRPLTRQSPTSVTAL